MDGSRLSRNSETVSPAKLSVSKNRAQKRPSGAADTDSPSKDKRRKENSRYFESEMEAVHKNKFDLPLSKELQRILLADWTEIRRGKKMTLPCYPTVAEITRMFIEQRKKRDEIDADGIRPSDVMHVVIEHFRFSLPKILLYENEKDVLDEIKTSTSENVEESQSSSCFPSWEEIFGGIHLLRLLGLSVSFIFGRMMVMMLLESVSESGEREGGEIGRKRNYSSGDLVFLTLSSFFQRFLSSFFFLIHGVILSCSSFPFFLGIRISNVLPLWVGIFCSENSRDSCVFHDIF